MVRIVAFDCDGVLLDFYGEDFVAAHNALLAVDPAADPLGRGRVLLSHPDIALAIPANPTFAAFRALATFVARAEDYLTTWHIIIERPQDIPAMTEAAFDQARQAWLDEYPAFKEAFYGARRTLQEQDMAAWLDMTPPYPGLPEAMAQIASAGATVVVATGRDNDSTWRLLQHHGMGAHVTEVVSRELSSHKDEQMAYLAGRYGVEPARLLFIDDALRNVRAVRGRATPWLATWGSARPEHVAQAQEEGIITVALAELADRLMQWIGRTS